MSLHPRISVDEECAGSIPFLQEVDFWKELGVTNIGVISPKIEAIGWDADVVAGTGLQVSNIGTEERVLNDALEFGAAVRADSVWITPGTIGSRLWEEAAEDFCARIEPAVTRAKELGVAFAIEPTNSMRLDISFIFTLRDAVALARAAHTGVVLELVSCWYEPGFENLVRENIDKISLVQVADFRIGTLSSPDRSVIGDGDIPLERLLRIILDAGYEGMFDLELIGPKIEHEGYLPATRRSLDRLGEMLDRLGA